MDAAKGVEKEIEFFRTEDCPTCHGTGAEKGSSVKKCDKCNGKGEIRYSQRTLFGESISVAACDKCGGSGEIPEKACHTCKGKKKVNKKKKIKINIPAGVDTGSVMTLRGEGNLGDKDAPRGDVLIYIKVASHKYFDRDNFDIYYNLHISFATATLGGEVLVPTIDGKIKLKLEPGTQGNTTKRISNAGIPVLNGYGRGNQYINIIVDVPKSLSSEQEEALRAFQAAMGENTSSDKNKNFFEKVKDALK